MNQKTYLGHFAQVLLVSILLSVFTCEHDETLDSSRNTFGDDIADITYLNGSFFTTNYDLSGHSGSQIDLLRFEDDGSRIFLEDHFDLGMNGQGYLAMANDSTNLYLQSRTTELLIKCSSVGEKAYLLYDDLGSNWHPAGLSYDPEKDSLLALYRNSQQPQSYRLRTLAPDLNAPAGTEAYVDLDFAGRGYYGIYALAWHNSGLYLLGVDSTGADILVTADHALDTFELEIIPDSTVVGLCFKEDDLFLSYRDRRIAYWRSY